jgi:hypothetical protein
MSDDPETRGYRPEGDLVQMIGCADGIMRFIFQENQKSAGD